MPLFFLPLASWNKGRDEWMMSPKGGPVKEAPLPLPLYIRDQSGARQIAGAQTRRNVKAATDNLMYTCL